jgi:uncharacterized protein (DUF2384 family)
MRTAREEQESARRMRRARQEAVAVLSTSARAILWLNETNAALDGEKPADIAAASEAGLQRVLAILGRIDHGVNE